MSLPDFSEFVSSVDVEVLKAEFAKEMPHIVQFDLQDPASSEKAIELLMQESAKTAAKISIAYLHAYHEWLRLQLQR